MRIEYTPMTPTERGRLLRTLLIISVAINLALAIFALWYVYPGRYYYTKTGPAIVRINRLTGNADVLVRQYRDT